MVLNKTVRWVLLSLNLVTGSRVSIRRHGKNGVDFIGGGSVASVIARFGDMEIVDSWIIDNALCIYVR